MGPVALMVTDAIQFSLRMLFLIGFWLYTLKYMDNTNLSWWYIKFKKDSIKHAGNKEVRRVQRGVANGYV